MTVTPEQLAATLRRRQQQSRLAFEQKAVWLRERLRNEMKTVLSQGTVSRAWLMGSLASRTFGAGSDVDVVVEGLPVERASAFAAYLEDALGTNVDLLRFEELGRDFQERILREGLAFDAQ